MRVSGSGISRLLLLVFVVLHAEGADVIDLDNASFNEIFATKASPIFVKFFAPWCKHCKKLAPVWELLAKEDLGDVLLGSADCDKSPGLRERFGVRGYPQMILFAPGGNASYEYTGDRSLSSLVKFAKEGWLNTSTYKPKKKLTKLEKLANLPWLVRAPVALILVVWAVMFCVCIGHTAMEYIRGTTPEQRRARALHKLNSLREKDGWIEDESQEEAENETATGDKLHAE